MELFTIGHSNHTSDRLIDLLAHHEITAIADVRLSPFSRRFSHFNQSFLKQTLSSAGIAYVFLGDMLGARPKDPRCYENGTLGYRPWMLK